MLGKARPIACASADIDDTGSRNPENSIAGSVVRIAVAKKAADLGFTKLEMSSPMPVVAMTYSAAPT